MTLTPVRTTLLAGTLGSTLAGLAPACLTCNDIGCGGGFEWTGQPTGGETLTPGTYRITVTLEENEYEVECVIAATYGDSDCAQPVRIRGAVDYTLAIDFGQADPDNWDPMDPVSNLYLTAADTSGSDDTSSETRGPTSVSIAITLDDTPLTTIDYDVEYVRDNAYRGDPACGFCDEIESRTHEW
jgi:hypothetical protein